MCKGTFEESIKRKGVSSRAWNKQEERREPNPCGKVAGGLPVAGGTKVVDWEGAAVWRLQ
jgi:hypothetical protein